jgi:transposase-like protein
MKTRRQFSPEFKAKAALEAIKGQRTLNEIASGLEIHPIQLSAWKRTAIEGLSNVFSGPRTKASSDEADLIASLYQEIGQLKMERDWLKKKSGLAASGPSRPR